MVKCVLNYLYSGFAVIHLTGYGVLALQRLVYAEEVGHFVKNVSGKLRNVLVLIVGRVGEGDCDYLLVITSAVQHGDVTNGIAAHQREGVKGLGAENQNVQRVAVITVGMGMKP